MAGGDGFSSDDPWAGGDSYRSALEARVGDELRSLGLIVEFEKRTDFAVYYLPDFTITGAFENDTCAAHYAETMDAYEARGGLGRTFKWVEAKPQDFLYTVRDDLGVKRKVGEYFKGAVNWPCTSDDFLRKHRKVEQAFRELWKPKKLAEKSGENVLVVGRVGGTQSLTILMTPTAAIFERNHPIANWPYWMADAERQRQQERYEQQSEAARIERERQQAAQQREQERLIATMRAEIKRVRLMVNLYTNRCVFCGELVPANTGHLFMFDGWKTTHKACVASGH